MIDVALTEWTAEGLLRHPSFRRFRQEVEPKSVTRAIDATTSGPEGSSGSAPRPARIAHQAYLRQVQTRGKQDRRVKRSPSSASRVAFGALVGHVVAQRRIELGIKQGELAVRLRMEQSTLSRLETGRVPMTVEHLRAVAQYIDMPAHAIIEAAERHAATLAKRGIRVVWTRDSVDGQPAVVGATLGALLLLLAARAPRSR